MKPTTIDKALREPDVCAATGYSSTQLKKKIDEDPDFPKPFKLSKDGRAIGFLSSEVAAYQAKRIAERDRELQQPKQPKPQPRALAASKAKQTPAKLTPKQRLAAAKGGA